MTKLITFIVATTILTSCNWKSSKKLSGFTSGEVTSIGETYDVNRSYVLVDTNHDGRADIQCVNEFARIGSDTKMVLGKSVDVAIWSDSISTRYHATLRE